MAHSVVEEKNKKPAVFLGSTQHGTHDHRISKAFWYDITCVEFCCQSQRANRHREKLQIQSYKLSMNSVPLGTFLETVMVSESRYSRMISEQAGGCLR